MDQRVAAHLSESVARRRWWLAIAGMVVCMVIFGANFVVSRHAALNGLTNHDLLALRFATAGLLLLPTFVAAGGLRTCGGVGWRHGAVLFTMSGFPVSYLLLTGVTLAPAAHGATIGPGTVTTIGIVGSVVLFGAVVTRNLVLGVAAVLGGLACLAIAGTRDASATTLWGDLHFLGVGLLWGLYPLLIQLWRVDPLRATAVVSVLSLAYLPFYAALYFRSFDIAPWWVLVAHAANQGVLNVIVGLWIWSWAAHVLGAAVVGRFPPLIPVVGTLLGIPVLGEIPGPLQLAGIALIFVGLTIASWRRGPPSPEPAASR